MFYFVHASFLFFFHPFNLFHCRTLYSINKSMYIMKVLLLLLCVLSELYRYNIHIYTCTKPCDICKGKLYGQIFISYMPNIWILDVNKMKGISMCFIVYMRPI